MLFGLSDEGLDRALRFEWPLGLRRVSLALGFVFEKHVLSRRRDFSAAVPWRPVEASFKRGVLPQGPRRDPLHNSTPDVSGCFETLR